MRRNNWCSFWRLCGAVLVLSLLFTPVAPANAFELTGLGPRVGMIDPDGVEGTVQFGAGFDFEKAGTRFHLNPNAMYWSEDGVSDVNANLDVFYHFSPAGRVSPYLGVGGGVHFYEFDGTDDSETDPSLNLFGGLLFPTSAATFFVEGRGVVSDRDQMGLVSGATFFLGR